MPKKQWQWFWKEQQSERRKPCWNEDLLYKVHVFSWRTTRLTVGVCRKLQSKLSNGLFFLFRIFILFFFFFTLLEVCFFFCRVVFNVFWTFCEAKRSSHLFLIWKSGFDSLAASCFQIAVFPISSLILTWKDERKMKENRFNCHHVNYRAHEHCRD